MCDLNVDLSCTYLWFGKGQHRNAGEFRQCDTRKHATSDIRQCLTGAHLICAFGFAIRSYNVRHEFNTDSNRLTERNDKMD